MRIAFRFLLVACLMGLSWFEFGQHRGFYELKQRFADNFDSRPALEILLLGNSRTFYNNMPEMLRDIADSAGSPQKYQITAQVPAGSSLEGLWHDGYTQQLLHQTWDVALVQAESRAFSSDSLYKSFKTYGPKLLSAIKLHGGRPDLIVNWAYEPTADKPFSESDRNAYQKEIDAGHDLIARHANAHEIRLSDVWNDVRVGHPEITMTTDGNHPTLAGSYLYALLLYSDLSKGDLSRVTFVPDGLTHETAAILKDAVTDHLPPIFKLRGSLAFTR